MAEHTRSSIVIEATPAEVMAVIADFEAYPQWTGEVKEIEVLGRTARDRATEVRLVLDAGAIRDEHVLAYTWDGDREVSWTLVKSQMLRSLDGSYALAAVKGGTEVTYQLAVDVKIPMLGMIKRKAEKVIIDRALAGLKKRVEGLTAIVPGEQTYRTVLVTGDAAGVPAVAAATALHAARRGLRTLLLAADDPHRLVDEQLGTRLDGVAAPVGEGLWAARVDQQDAFRRAVAGLDGRLRTGFDLLGVHPLEPDELTALPGTAQFALLHALRHPPVPASVPPEDENKDERGWDLVVAAAPPPAELTAALALPEQLDRYLARLVPEQRQAARALRPLLAAVAGVPMPADWVYTARAWAARELAAAREVIESPATSVRLVADAGSFSLQGLRRAASGLALFGHRLDAVVAHRALPAAALGSADPWLAGQAARERERLAAIGLGVPLLTADQSATDLTALADQLYGDGPDPEPAGAWPWTAEDRLAEDGVLTWRLAAPGADRADLDLMRRGDELMVGLGPYRRILPLPGALRRCTVAGAALRDGELTLRFAPDPDLWPGAR